MASPTLEQADVSAPAQSAPVRVEAGPHSPLRKTSRDMFRALAVVAIIIGGMFLLTWRPSPDPVRVVNVDPVANLADREARFRVLVPDLDSGWRPTSARLQPTPESKGENVWFTGGVTATNQYVALVQSEAKGPRFIAEQTDSARPTERSEGLSVPLGAPGKSKWKAYETVDQETRALVKRGGSHATIVKGTASWAELGRFAAGLVPVATLDQD